MVNLALALVIGYGQLDALEQQAWVRLKRSVVKLERNGQTVGHAVLVNQNGLFLAPKSTVQPGTQAMRYDGKSIELSAVGSDGTSQLSVLQSKEPTTGMVPVGLPPFRPGTGTRLLAVFPNGPSRAQVTAHNKIGVVKGTNRALPLLELKCEVTDDELAGGLLFSRDGNFLGAMLATLSGTQQQVNNFKEFQANADQTGVAAQAKNAVPRSYGPTGLLIGFIPAPEVVQRAIIGLSESDHRAKYGSIGVFCRDGRGVGAEVETLDQKGSAKEAGLRPGDFILSLGSTAIRDTSDFVRGIYALTPGTIVLVSVQRGGQLVNFRVTVKESPQ